MKAALYVRVSLDRDADDYRFQDPNNQVGPLTDWAKSIGYEIVETYVDRCSGGDSNRPDFLRMRKDAHQHKFDAILVWSLDRFSREGISNTLSYLKDLKRFNVGVRALQDSWFDTTKESSFAELIIAIFSWFAEHERTRISERTKAGIARRKALKTWKGGRPSGSQDKKPRKKRPPPSTLDGGYGGV